MSVVAFSDPNDLLSYEINSSFADEFTEDRFTNVRVGVAGVAAAYLAAIAKTDHKVIKEELKPLLEELIEVGVKQAFVDAADPKALPDPLVLQKFLEHLAQPAKA